VVVCWLSIVAMIIWCRSITILLCSTALPSHILSPLPLCVCGGAGRGCDQGGEENWSWRLGGRSGGETHSFGRDVVSVM